MGYAGCLPTLKLPSVARFIQRMCTNQRLPVGHSVGGAGVRRPVLIQLYGVADKQELSIPDMAFGKRSLAASQVKFPEAAEMLVEAKATHSISLF